MQKKQVAIIDIGSSKVTAIIGENGVNNTFIIKGRFNIPFEGYADGSFFDNNELEFVLRKAVKEILKYSTKGVDTIYVGVPSNFTQVLVKDSQISFPKKKRIQPEDLDTLYDAAFALPSTRYTLISRSAVNFELDDFRRLKNPIGAVSEILKGKLSFVYCSNYFLESVVSVIKGEGIQYVKCIPTAFAEGMYLTDDENRDRLMVLLDVGYIATDLTIMQGDGIIFQSSFSYGGGFITAGISEKYNIEFPVAERVKRKVNLCSLVKSGDYNVIDGEDGNYYSAEEIKRLVLDSIDELCDNIFQALEDFGTNIPDYVPLYLTGGGITCLRGAKEHLAERLGMNVEVISPRVPLMDKPAESSALSLLDMALSY